MAKPSGARSAPKPGKAGAGLRGDGGFHRFANPGRFLRLADRLLPYISAAPAKPHSAAEQKRHAALLDERPKSGGGA